MPGCAVLGPDRAKDNKHVVLRKRNYLRLYTKAMNPLPGPGRWWGPKRKADEDMSGVRAQNEVGGTRTHDECWRERRPNRYRVTYILLWMMRVEWVVHGGDDRWSYLKRLCERVN